jgi:tetratricopeptide (TPR) repeat protein
MKIHRKIIGVWVCLMICAFQGVLTESRADDSDKPWVSRVISVQGHVLVKRQGGQDWKPVKLNETLFAGDEIRVDANSRAGIVLSNDAVLRLDQNTTLVFTEIEEPATFIFKLLKGAANFFSHRPHSLKIVTPFVNGVVEGTEFYVRVDAHQTHIDLFEGRVLAQNAHGELQLVKGQQAVALAGLAPRARILVHPRDSVQWALYYPPVLSDGPAEGPSGFSGALALYNQGRSAEALGLMDTIAPKNRNTGFYILRAGLLLNVGRVNYAQKDIQQALTRDPGNASALSLRTIIAVVQNRKDEALALAREAVQRNPRSAAAQIALSYARQADFELPEALQAARTAVSSASDNATAWARLAELQLCSGELDRGIQSAQKAVALNPRVAHARTILGFAYLTQIKTRMAQEAFNQAIALDSTAPLPRLGLGLTKIRAGDLEAGRAQLEIAAGLDPANALIRSYLGKAYFDERRGLLDGQQLEIAKKLDPKDPTPWFYDAIRKQTYNRPVEALKDLQTSMALNNNRAVYRSQLLLDQDLAARNATIGRIYGDLGFEELAVRQGYKSLNADHTNFSAHRLLADTYSSLPRHDIARVSELLKAQLLQPINILPVQPQLAATNLFIFNDAGPSRPSFNEFNQLFNRNRLGMQVSGVAGNNDTFGEEVVVSAVYDNISVSAGQFYYETDGFRINDDLKQEIYNAFAQISLTPKTSIQGEIRFRDSERGDPYLRFLPEDVIPTVRRPQDIGSGRFGFHHQFSSSSDLIGSLIYTDAETKYTIPGSASVETLDKGYVGEIQHLWRWQILQLTTGGGYLSGDRKSKFVTPLFSIEGDPTDLEHRYGYVYSSIRFPNNITWTLGLSADDFEGFVERDQINPKFGFYWELFKNTTLRGAAYRVLEDTLIAKQKLEPTQVAGFNQFYEEMLDGGEGVDVSARGIGIDQRFSSAVSGGLEFFKRDLDLPYIAGTGLTDEVTWKENTLRGYLYAALMNWMSINFGYQYEEFKRDPDFIGEQNFSKLTTNRFPLGVNLFLPQGLSIKAKTTYIVQKGTFGEAPGVTDDDSFWVFDATVSYRLPSRYGILSIDAKNLFDESFKFQDTDPTRPTVFPERQILAKLTMSF